MKLTSGKLAILSLSLMLVSTYSISAILPFMLDYYKGCSSRQVDILISIPSFAIMLTILASTWLARYLNERLMITGGLLLLSLSGIAPLFIQDYPFVLLTRILLGLGIGLVNSRAVSMISERFDGTERTALLGYRSAAETLGNALLTFAAGQLLLFHWTKAFLIYAFGFVILAFYLLFGSDRQACISASSHTGSSPSVKSGGSSRMILFYAVSAGCLICTSSSISMRIPLLVLEKSYANESQASTVLGLFLLVGIISGILYEKLTSLVHGHLFSASALACCIGLLVIVRADSIPVLTAGAVISGLAHTAAITCVFNGLPVHLPIELIHTATSIVLLGCNLGASLTPFVIGFAEHLHPGASTAFYACAILLSAAAIINTILNKVKPDAAISVL